MLPKQLQRMIRLEVLKLVQQNVAKVFTLGLEEKVGQHHRWLMPLPATWADRLAANHDARRIFGAPTNTRRIEECFDFKSRHLVTSTQHLMQFHRARNPANQEDARSNEPRIQQQSTQNILGSAQRHQRGRLKPGPGLKEV
jgi:hypothetical protein